MQENDKLTAQAQELSDNLVGIVDLYEKVENADTECILGWSCLLQTITQSQIVRISDFRIG